MTAPDLLSQVLAQVRLQGERVATIALAGADRLPLRPGIAALCVVTEGEIRHRDIGRVEKGDLLLVNLDAGGAHPFAAAAEGPSRVTVYEFRFDAASNALVSGLPDLILVKKAEGGKWLETLALHVLAELGNPEPGAALMISRLIDLMVIRTLRTWAQRSGERSRGWLRGLGDPRIARVLRALHDRPFAPWNVEDLAALAGMSRSSLSATFTDRVGVPPLRYLARWRLAQARDLLALGRHRVGEVALSIGYDSEAAFSRAYKSEFGHSPRQDLARRLENPSPADALGS